MEVGWLEEEMGEEEPRDHTRTGLALSHAHGRKRFKEKDLKPRRGDRGQKQKCTEVAVVATQARDKGQGLGPERRAHSSRHFKGMSTLIELVI